jgi:isopenicillin-N epimerase
MSLTRRALVSRSAAIAGAVVAMPDHLFAETAGTIQALAQPSALPHGNGPMPAIPDGNLTPEFWADLRKSQFLIPADEAFFNTGTLGSSPKVVRDAVIDHMNHVDRDIAHWDYKADHEQYFTGYAPEEWVRSKLAKLVNAQTDEIALTQNATFGMNFIANGLQLGVGDEVICDLGAHPGGRCGWELRDKRYGANVKFVTIPAVVTDPQQLIDLYERATTPQTKVWAIPHLTSGTAVRFPVDEMCRRARDRGILTVIDGAQTLGHLIIDVKAMGCDVFFSSPHKWMLAPKGTGILYVRKEVQPRVWSTLASTEWDNHNVGAYRLMQYGTGNLSLLVGLEKAVDFQNELQPARIEERVLMLASRLRAGLQQIPKVTITSPMHPALQSATTVWGMAGLTGGEIQDALWENAKVRVRSMGTGVRHCCHIYNLESEVDRALEHARKLARA